jgi:DnaJ-class molecular chaperone
LHHAPLEPREFLHGRRRARERGSPAPSPVRERQGQRDDANAWHILGVPPGADVDSIKRAYRRLARTVHPDLHPEASAEEKRALETRFAQITEAYRALVA